MKMKKMLASLLVIALALPLAACGGKKNDPEKTGEGGKNPEQTREFVWVPEYTSLDSEYGDFYNAYPCGDYLYFDNYIWDKETMTGTTMISSISLVDGSKGPEIQIGGKKDDGGNGASAASSGTNDGEDGEADGEVGGEPDGELSDGEDAGEEDFAMESDSRNLGTFLLDKEGNFLTIENIYHWDEDSGTSSQQFFFCKYDSQGNQMLEQDLTEKIMGDSEYAYIQSMAADDEGHIYLAGESGVHLLDADGKYCGKIGFGGDTSWINSLGTGKDGKVYAAMYDVGKLCLKELDFAGKSAGATYSNFPSGNGGSRLFKGEEYDFLVNGGTALYGYSLKDQTSEKLLDWLDSDINGDYVNCVCTMEDGRIMALVRDWETNASEVAVLTKKNASEVTVKTDIVIGTLYMDSDLRSAAVNFNKKNDSWHVSVKAYYDYNNVTNDNYEQVMQDALTRLNNDITSDNCPDLLVLSGINDKHLAAKGAFEDLAPYLEKSSVLGRSDFLENILAAYTYNGVLVSIPKSFQLETLAGKASELGTKPGWTMEEMMAYMDQHPKAEPFDYATRASILTTMLMYNQGSYVDWENGKCSFDSESFVKVLEFANRFPEEYNYNEDEAATPLKIAAGDVLMYRADLYDFNSIQTTEAIIGEPVNYIGYPNDAGDSGTYLYASTGVAIASKSSHKDGAWAFLEDYLSTESRYSYGFSTNKKEFENAKEAATKAEYLKDENGELVVDENGEPILISGGGSWGWGDWNYEYHLTTEEEVETLMKLIESAKPASMADTEILKMVTEEAEAFFKGQKSAKDVAGVIQSRVQIYVQENS